jgi:hypothetical protein
MQEPQIEVPLAATVEVVFGGQQFPKCAASAQSPPPLKATHRPTARRRRRPWLADLEPEVLKQSGRSFTESGSGCVPV